MATDPVDAATVILLRSGADSAAAAIEVLLVRRNRRSSFVPGYYVFPGGVLDPEDWEPGAERFIRGLDRRRAAEILRDLSPSEKALGAWVGGIRETFEEVGLLIARFADGSPVAIRTDDERRRFGDYRRAIIRGETTFLQMLEAENLFLPADVLHYFSHWITPEFLPQRYDVRFFVTPVPEEQTAVCDGVELTHHSWLSPSVALADYEAGKIGMVLPQIVTLRDLARFQTVEDVIRTAARRLVPATLTKIVQVDGRAVEVMPDETVFTHRPPVYP